MHLTTLHACKSKSFHLRSHRQTKYLLNAHRPLKSNNFPETVTTLVNTRYLKEMLDARITRTCTNNINLSF